VRRLEESGDHFPLDDLLVVEFIGDCVKPSRILEAMREGFEPA
jgi:hypothetical protein